MTGSFSFEDDFERKLKQAAANYNHHGPDIRLEMEKRLPLIPRSVMDLFTGKPILDGKSQPFTLGPVSYLALNTAIGLAAAAATAATVICAPAWMAAPIVFWTMLIQTGRMRKNQTHLGHEASHGNLFLRGDPRREEIEPVFLGMNLNDLLGELATTIALSPNMADYGRDHARHHSLADYTTGRDPDVAYVRPLADLRRALLDPRAYVGSLMARLRSNLLAVRYEDVDDPSDEGPVEKAVPHWGRRLMGAAWISFLAGLAFLMPFWAWFFAVFLPYAVLFRISGILQILSLHAWDLPPAASYQEYADRTFGRFSGIALPKRGLRGLRWLKAWSAWWAEMLLVELPFRLGVLSSDLQNHDIHHLEWVLVHDLKRLDVFVDDWRNQAFRRAEVIRDTGDALRMSEREVWGVRAMWKIANDNLRRLKAAG